MYVCMYVCMYVFCVYVFWMVVCCVYVCMLFSLKTAGSDVEQSVTVVAVYLAHGRHDKDIRALAQTIQEILMLD